jgi:hypothetical protein
VQLVRVSSVCTYVPDHTGLVVIPSNDTTVAENAFLDCTELKKVLFEEGTQLTSINQTAFYRSGLTSIVIPAGCVSIGVSAFELCVSLVYVSFVEESQLLTIGDRAFQRTSIRSIIIPNSVVTLGAQVLTCCDGSQTNSHSTCGLLESVVMQEFSVLQTIGSQAFCQSTINSFSFPNTVLTIGSEAFYQCNNLTSLTFQPGFMSPPEGSHLQGIGESAFFMNKNLVEVNFPASLVNINASAFYACNSLSKITFDAFSKLESIKQEAFEGAGLVDTVHFPDSLLEIGFNAFTYNYDLEGATFGCDSKVNIASNVFSGTSIETLQLPNTAVCNSCGPEVELQCCPPVCIPDGDDALDMNSGGTGGFGRINTIIFAFVLAVAVAVAIYVYKFGVPSVAHEAFHCCGFGSSDEKNLGLKGEDTKNPAHGGVGVKPNESEIC